MTTEEILRQLLLDSSDKIIQCLRYGYSVEIFNSRNGLKIRKNKSFPVWIDMSVKYSDIDELKGGDHK